MSKAYFFFQDHGVMRVVNRAWGGIVVSNTLYHALIIAGKRL